MSGSEVLFLSYFGGLGTCDLKLAFFVAVATEYPSPDAFTASGARVLVLNLSGEKICSDIYLL